MKSITLLPSLILGSDLVTSAIWALDSYFNSLNWRSSGLATLFAATLLSLSRTFSILIVVMYIGSLISCSGKVGEGFAIGWVEKFVPKLELSKLTFSLASEVFVSSSFMMCRLLYLEELATEIWCQNPFGFCFLSAAIASSWLYKIFQITFLSLFLHFLDVS